MSIERLSSYLKEQGNIVKLALGSFSLTKIIGQGGNGLVYEANLQERVLALKFLITEATGESREQKLSRFLAEYFNIIIMDDLTGIVRYIDYDLLEFSDKMGILKIPIIIMNLYDSSLVKRQLTKNEEEFIALFEFLIDTTEKIHKYGIIHRDIKPENILVNGKGYVLADFGIANYNPEMFHVWAETDRKERLGNRLFSAPEQEEKSVEPHSTMDIYAIGQVLQWYATGKTHRGTGRQSVTTSFQGCKIYDGIIEKCLENNPSNRFQSIAEIRNYIAVKHEKNLWHYLRLFNQICRMNYPKNDFRIIHSDNINRIDKLLQTFYDKGDEFNNNFWWHDGSSNLDITPFQKGVGKWKFWDDEYSIKEIWIHYDNSIYNDYILVHYLPSEPFNIDGKEVFYTSIVDDEHHISYSENNNGYAEINGKIEDLSKHKVESIERQEKEGYFFLGTRFSCVLQKENDEALRKFIEKSLEKSKIELDELREFTDTIRRHKHFEVFRDM